MSSIYGPITIDPSQRRRSWREDWFWIALGLILTVTVAAGLRVGSAVTQQAAIGDERLMKVPIDAIIEKGWSIETALDYQEVKGPVFYWLYAAAGQVIGGAMNDLRLVSVAAFVLGVIPLLAIARRAGVAGPLLLLAAAFYVLLPYHAPRAQLLMSEPSFMLIALALMWVFVWGFGDQDRPERRVIGPILFAVLLSALLHHRPHAVVFAGAAALIALERDGLRSWPWWLACIVAGLSRLPLWHYWGGLVTSDYQDLFTFGLRIDCQTYLLAAVLPSTSLFLWPVLRDPVLRRRWYWPAGGAVIGLVLGIVAVPDIHDWVEYVLPGDDEPTQQLAYAGVVATAVKSAALPEVYEHALLTALAALGGASLGALLAVAWRVPVASTDGVVRRASFWMLATGLPLYIITAGPIYDRYLLVWVILLPVAWVTALPPLARFVQLLILLAMAGYFAATQLM